MRACTFASWNSTADLDPDEFIKANGAERILVATGTRDRLLPMAGGSRATQVRYDQPQKGASPDSRHCCFPPFVGYPISLERAAVAGEVAEYLGVDRSLVLEGVPHDTGLVAGTNGSQAPKMPESSMTERVLLRSLLADPEVRETLLERLSRV